MASAPAKGLAVSQIQLVNAVSLGGAYETAFYAKRGAEFAEDAIGVTVTTPKGSARIPWGNIKAAHYGKPEEAAP
jgi:hypothetical protein